MLGMEAALLVTSGTMGNLTSILAHCMERGSEVTPISVLDQSKHPLLTKLLPFESSDMT